MKILCIDDNRVDLETLQRSLIKAKQDVAVTAMPLEGLRLAQEFRPDLIMLDIYMRDMDGLIVAELLRGMAVLKQIGTRIIAMTAVTNSEDPHLQERMFAAGCDGFIYKPLSYNHIMVQIENALADRVNLSPMDEREFLIRNSSDFANRFRQKYTELQSKMREVADLQESLIKMERLSSVGRISMQLAHEINNPLTSLMLNLECLTTFNHGTSQWNKHFALVQEDTKRLVEMTRVLLQSQQRDQSNFQQVNLASAIDDTLRLYAKKAREVQVTLVTSLESDVIHIHGSPVQIRQLFSNLVSNAIDAMPGGGTLEIALYWHKPDLYVTVADTGIGLPLDVPAFELFYSTKPTGHGIGLYTSRLIADAHGAHISWGPNLPKGTIFTVKFPTS